MSKPKSLVPGKIFILLFLLCLFIQSPASARDLKASIAIIPGHSEIGPDGKPRGGFIDLVKAIDEVYTDGKISIELYPFPRSIANVVNGKADFHLPLAKMQNPPASKFLKAIEKKNLDLPYAYLDERMTELVSILYTNSAKPPIDTTDLKKLKNYEFATISGNSQYYSLKIKELTTIESGIQMVLKGRIDGYIMEQDATDDYIKQNKISGLRRQLFAIKDSDIVIAKGEKGKEIGRILTVALKKLKKSGKLQSIVKNIHHPYHEWQPYKTKF
jgi:polar amino acid transport system substrate-binding protein